MSRKKTSGLIPVGTKPGNRPADGYEVVGTKLGPRRPAGGYQPVPVRPADIAREARKSP